MCATEAGHPTEFLELVAVKMATAFEVGIVAVEFGDDAGPKMLVGDDLLSAQIDRPSIRKILSGATTAPIACEVPFSHPSASRSSEAAGGTRGLSVQISESPRRTAFLLVYRAQQIPSPVEQIHHLKQLNLYADAIRTSISNLPVEVPRGEAARAIDESRANDGLMTADSAAGSSGLTSELGNRQSLQLFHQDLNVDATAYRIANESRRLLQCDRVTVLLPQAGRYRVRAMSGVSVIDSRSNSVRCTEALTYYASAMARPLILPGDEPLPPQIQEPLDAYLDETGITAACLLPLHGHAFDPESDDTQPALIDPFEGTGDVVAVLILEYFSGDPPQTITPPVSLVATEALIALRNSLEHDKIFGLGLWKFIGASVAALRRPLVAFAVLMIASLLIASAIIPVEHYVVASGTSQPARERQVFAGVDGIVKTIHVSDGETVKAGELILELENAELESQAESITGEIITTAQRLASIQRVRLSGESDPNQSGRLVLEERQLESELTNLRAQQALVEKQQQELLIKSPIDGTVVAWQLDRRLSNRPVARGNLLVSLVDHSGPWLLRLTVPDDNAGPVLEALQTSSKLPVRFAMATVPDATYAASLDSLSTATRMDESGRHVIDVVASVSESDADQFAARSLMPFDRRDVRVGADVTAKIVCGKRTVLRSWFGDVFDFVDRNVLFYFR